MPHNTNSTLAESDVRLMVRLLGEVIVAFMCVPKDRQVATRFEATLSRVWTTGADRLTEYQFAGDHEGHGVPHSK